MKIEEILDLEKVKDDLTKALISIYYTSNYLRDIELKLLKPYGINQQHFNVLRFLKSKFPTPCSIGQIKNGMMDKNPDVTRLIDKLERMGLVDRHYCPNNRRKMDVQLTEEGNKRIKIINSDFKSNFIGNSWNLNNEEARQIINLLDKLRENDF